LLTATGTTITVANAQTVFTPDYLVFVANLRSDASLDDLCVALSGVFPRFGPCTIRVVRHGDGMKIAFIQYSVSTQTLTNKGPSS